MRRTIAVTIASLALVFSIAPVAVASDDPTPDTDGDYVCLTQRAAQAEELRLYVVRQEVDTLNDQVSRQAQQLAEQQAKIDRKNHRIHRQARLIKRLRHQLAAG